ncbi:MAG: PAS domain-containing protein [Desulfuromonadales bacterium]|nr:PAS domain-containing protein [Desulfuromonadales bacterium]
MRRLVWQIFPSFLLLILLCLVAVSWFTSRSLREFHVERTAADLEARARLVAEQLRHFPVGTDAALDALSKQLGELTGTRITIVLDSGRVVGETSEDPARMESHAGRPEIAPALTGRVGTSIRFSRTLQKEMMYVAVPVASPVAGAVRAALPLDAIDLTLRELYLRMVLGGVGVAILAALISLAIARRISRPLEEMRLGAARFAAGAFDQRLAVGGSAELHALAEAMNRMAVELDARMRTVLLQRNEQEAVLASMVEGVLAVDAEERILRLNRAAADLLRVDPQQVQGRHIQEVIRKIDLQRFVARALASPLPVEGDIVLREQEEQRFLQAHGAPLRNAEGKEIGALVVLNDVTRLRRLETIRRDFVANVSHELKTPITAIKGFVETLQDGALESPEDARRFLAIIIRQADRLNAIVEDLLDLSRIEQYGEGNEIPLQLAPLDPILRGAIQATAIQAAAKEIRIEVDSPPGLQARIDPSLLEQAVINLVDNAVKYSDPGGRVRLEAEPAGDELLIRVRDWGCGIERQHLPRLFERFYRVDRARSRKQGGTGLGLAIVKHIAQAHGGRVSVQSTPGQGCVFVIHLPALRTLIQS